MAAIEEEFYTYTAKVLFDGYSDIIGDAAQGIVKEDENVVLNDDGEIEEFKGGSEELEELIQEFEDTIGAVAVTIGKNKIKENIDQNDEEKIPEIIRGEN